MKRFLVAGALLIACLTVGAQETKKLVGEGVTLQPLAVTVAPVIDGRLDDAAWSGEPLVDGRFITTNPVYGLESDQKTRVWMAYDPHNIYLAFYCHDSDPGKIKASITRRDNPFGDDWVGVDIDTLGTRQTVHEIICNPLGMQADLINTAAGGESADPDWVWYSAGRVVEDGYIVEIKLPVKSFKFRNAESFAVNVAFYRFISRSGTNSSWPQINQEKGYFNSLIPAVLTGLSRQLRLETLPAFTYGSIWDRQRPQTWSEADDSAQLGIGIKYGITSSLDAEITINPDFSQVESDQFQVEANQRYPLFYNEKRPFFMDVTSQFDLGGLSGEGNFWSAIHTRNIVDPAWGGKIAGNVGDTFVGFLAAGDEWPRDPEGGRSGQAGTYIGRIKHSLHGDNYVGLLYSGHFFAGDSNQVIAADTHLRLWGRHSLAMSGLFSLSHDAVDGSDRQGAAATLLYQYGQKPLDLFAMLEFMDRDFKMESAFYLRTGITKLTAYIGPKFYPRSKGLSWLKRFNPFVYGFVIHDHQSGGDDFLFFPALRFFLARQSWIRFDFRYLSENWAGRDFSQRELVIMGLAQPNRWFSLQGRLRAGRRLYYDREDPFLGNQLSWTLSATFQPNSQLTQDLEHTYQRFSRPAGGGLVYDLNLLVSRTTYQINRHLFLRALVQYDSYSRRILSDLLASFTLIPGTVLHLGYGSLHQKRTWHEELQEWRELPGSDRFYQTTQSLFFKASYLLRF